MKSSDLRTKSKPKDTKRPFKPLPDHHKPPKGKHSPPSSKSWHKITRIPQLGFHSHDYTARIPQRGLGSQDSATRTPQPGFHSQDSTARIIIICSISISQYYKIKSPHRMVISLYCMIISPNHMGRS